MKSSYFFENINKIDKSLAKLIKRDDENKIRNESGDIITNITKIKRIIRK